MKLISCCMCGRVADPGPLHGWVHFDHTEQLWPPNAHACLECFNKAYRIMSMERRAALMKELRLRAATTRTLEGDT